MFSLSIIREKSDVLYL